jgi:hypothetical protein
MTEKTPTEPSVMAQRIYDAAEKLNYPSGQRLYTYLKNNKQYIPYEVINQVYDKENAQATFLQGTKRKQASSKGTCHARKA